VRLFLLIAFAFFAAYCNAQVIVTYAGSSVAGFGGDGAAATNAKLGEPTGVAMDKKGNLFIADQLEGRIRKVAPQRLTIEQYNKELEAAEARMDAGGRRATTAMQCPQLTHY